MKNWYRQKATRKIMFMLCCSIVLKFITFLNQNINLDVDELKNITLTFRAAIKRANGIYWWKGNVREKNTFKILFSYSCVQEIKELKPN